MSSEWHEVRLENITSVLGDGLHGTPEYDESGDYHFINGNNLRDGKIEINGSTRRTSINEYQKYKKNLNNRTILVSINGTLGNVALYHGEKVILGKSACYFNVQEGVDKQFVRYVLTSDLFQDYIHTLATGSTIQNVSLKLMRNFSFRLPPFELQQKISKVLTSLDDRIALLRETNATLEAIAQALFKSWFVDFDPVHAKQQDLAPEGMDEATAALFPDSFDESELGLVPRGWRIGKVEQLLELAYGKALKASDRTPGVIPVYGSGGVTGYHNEALVNNPSIVIGRKGTVGSLYWEDRPFFPIDTVFYVKTKEPLTYCFYQLQRLGLEGMNTDGAVPGLNRNNVYRLPILLPPHEMLLAFDEKISPLRRKIFTNSEQAQTLATLRDTLLPRLISGQLSLSVAETLTQEI